MENEFGGAIWPLRYSKGSSVVLDTSVLPVGFPCASAGIGTEERGIFGRVLAVALQR